MGTFGALVLIGFERLIVGLVISDFDINGIGMTSRACEFHNVIDACWFVVAHLFVVI